MEITYSKYGDYYLPDLVLSKEEPATYGRFGRMRLKYLKEHRKVLYINLLTSGELTRHLNEIDRQAREMLELLVKQMAQAQGITEQLKTEDGSVKSYAQICFGIWQKSITGGGLTAPWLHYSRQGAKGQGRRYAARLALDALRTGCYHPA